ncbi:MAG: TadE family protein [Acidimicrobiales bacterium]
MSRSRGRGDRGAAALELVLVTPLLVMLLLFIVFCGRTAGAKGDVIGAARDAARAASIERDPISAQAAAETAAGEALHRLAVGCETSSTTVEFRPPPIEDPPETGPPGSDFRRGGTVRVTVSCDIRIKDLSLLALPGTKTLSSTAVEVIDKYRGTAAAP